MKPLKTIDETKRALERAGAIVGRVRCLKGEPGCYCYQVKNGEDVWTSPVDSYQATVNARRRAVIEKASELLSCVISRLHPSAMGKTYRELAAAMARREDNDGAITAWKWKPEARARASERAKARWARHREALEREALERDAPRILAARATMEAATATARALVPASVPPAHRESFAVWIAAGW